MSGCGLARATSLRADRQLEEAVEPELAHAHRAAVPPRLVAIASR